jgi:hypothetical protein
MRADPIKNKLLAYAAIAICGGTGSSLKSRRRHPPPSSKSISPRGVDLAGMDRSVRVASPEVVP